MSHAARWAARRAPRRRLWRRDGRADSRRTCCCSLHRLSARAGLSVCVCLCVSANVLATALLHASSVLPRPPVTASYRRRNYRLAGSSLHPLVTAYIRLRAVGVGRIARSPPPGPTVFTTLSCARGRRRSLGGIVRRLATRSCRVQPVSPDKLNSRATPRVLPSAPGCRWVLMKVGNP